MIYMRHVSLRTPWPISLIDSEFSRIICIVWALYVLKKNPQMKMLLLTVLPGKKHQSPCQALTVKYSDYSSRFTDVFHHVFQRLTPANILSEDRRKVYQCRPRPSDYVTYSSGVRQSETL